MTNEDFQRLCDAIRAELVIKYGEETVAAYEKEMEREMLYGTGTGEPRGILSNAIPR